MQSVDILILSNGPGEITTWVRPVVQALRQTLGDDRQQVRISVMLSPCPHAMGNEAEVVRKYPEVDRVQASQDFFNFLLWGKTAENWDWRNQGVVLFLGGDQFYALILGKKLGYRTVIYAEWEARWTRWIDAFGVMNESVKEKVRKGDRHKLMVTGDLMADVESFQEAENTECPIIGLLPGSKPSKLTQGVPLCLGIAEAIKNQRPNVRFQLVLAPTLAPETLIRYADPLTNPMVNKMGGISAKLIATSQSSPSAELPSPPFKGGFKGIELSPSSLCSEEGLSEIFLETTTGLKIELITEFPAQQYLHQFTLALTTVGANTAQLGALTVPMLVLLPTQNLEAMQSWDGLPGLLARLPILGNYFAQLINGIILSKKRLYAWPNIWAGREIVPELIGHLDAESVAKEAIALLDHPEQLAEIKHQLRQVRGKPGAAKAIADLVIQQIEK